MKAILRRGFLALAIMALMVPANAGPYEDGVAAYKRGDYATALKILRPLAERGDAEAQAKLGFIYHFGKGVPQDYEEAVKWFRMAAEQGDARGQHDLGLSYGAGAGVPQDFEEAARWLRLAAEQGYDWAQLQLANYYFLGTGVPQDYVLSHMWFNLAAAQGNYFARRDLRDIARKMPPDQIAEAQRMAREWMEKHQR